MDGGDVPAILKRDIHVSAEVSGHLGALLSNNCNSVSAIGPQKIPGFEHHIISRGCTIYPFEGVVFGEEEDTARAGAGSRIDLLVDSGAPPLYADLEGGEFQWRMSY